jgi:hypothetical protein
MKRKTISLIGNLFLMSFVILTLAGCLGGGGGGSGSSFGGSGSSSSFASSGSGSSGSGSGAGSDVATTHNPEPASILLLSSGLLGLALRYRKRHKK